MISTDSSHSPNYTDEDITFFVGIYRDRLRAADALTRIRQHFPEARIVARSDGDRDPQNYELAEQFGVDYREEERLYPIENGGAMIARMLELFLEQPTRYLLKIDTDTAAYRRFHFLPQENGVFGTLQTAKQGCQSVQGGFTGLTDETARVILDSGILGDARLKDPASCSNESAFFSRMAKRVERTGLCGFDWIIGWAAHELGLPLIAFSEVHCRWFARNNVPNLDLQFAMTHPVYFDGVSPR
jgi:hypothetical protein